MKNEDNNRYKNFHKKGLFNFNQIENQKKKEEFYPLENKNVFYENDFYEVNDFETGDIIIEQNNNNKIYDNIREEHNYYYNENNEIKLLNFSESKKNKIEDARELRNLFKSFIGKKEISFELDEFFETVNNIIINKKFI